MKHLFFYLLFVVSPFLVLGQESDSSMVYKRNTIYGEALGQGLIGSVSYDRLYITKDKKKYSFTIGVTLPVIEDTRFGIPLSFNYLIGKKNSSFEVGMGFTALLASYRSYFTRLDDARNNISLYATPKIGYRFQRRKGGLFFRATLTPILGLSQDINPSAFLWFGVSVGYTF